MSLCKVSGGPTLAGTYPGCQIWASTDEGVTWNPIQSLAPGTRVRDITDLGNGTVLAGTDYNGQVWVSYNYGASFSLLAELGSGVDVLNILFDSPNYAIAGTGNMARIFGCALYISPPIAAFTALPISGDVPLTVQFTDESTNTPITWLWDFGDGETSTEKSPIHTYIDAGTYTVSLTVHNYAGTDAETKIGLISATSIYKRFSPIWTMQIGTL
jgi:PKD repeat protein